MMGYNTPLLLATAAFGALFGWWCTAEYYQQQNLKQLVSQAEAYALEVTKALERADHYKQISEEYYADYQNAINREPTIVTERVFVRANCPSNAATNPGGSVGDAAAVERVELHAETVASAARVTDQAERDVLSCRAALHSLQRKIKAHNELQR